MSDHYGVLGFVDVHAAHELVVKEGERADGEDWEDVRSRRRAALAGVRDQACLEEQFVVQAMLREGRENAAVQRAQGDAKRREELVRESKAAQRARRAERQSLWEGAFGQGSLFSAGKEGVFEELGQAPLPPQDVVIDAYEDLSRVDAKAVWRSGYPI